MRILFADTFYWIALISPKDTWHNEVMKFNHTLTNNYKLILTDGVVDEIFAFFSKEGEQMRKKTMYYIKLCLTIRTLK